MGALGRLMAGWLLQHRKVHHVLLLGRTATGQPQDLAARHGAASLCSCDIADIGDASVLVATDKRSPPISGVIHAGGALADASLANQTVADMRAAFAPKVYGALNCQHYLYHTRLAAMVLFSSTSSLFGSPGQSSYSAANAALDGLATARWLQGCADISVQWGAWAGGGMALQDPSTVRRLERNGMGFIQPHGGLSALEEILGSRREQGSVVSVSKVNWPRLSSFSHINFALDMPGAALLGTREPHQQQIADTPEHRGSVGRIVSSIACKDGPAAQEFVEGLVAEDVRGILGRTVQHSSNLFEEGLDSIEVMELRSSLTESTGVDIELQAMYDNPTISLMASYVLDNIAGFEEKQQSLPSSIASEQRAPTDVGTAQSIEPIPSEPTVPISVNLLVDSSTTPVFLQQPMGVPGSRAYYNFVRCHLGWVSPNPVYVLDHPTAGQPGDAPPGQGAIEDFMKAMLERIDRCQSSGPYVLGGHSLGGLTSLQLAIMKSDAGQVAEVMMFDSAHPKQLPKRSNEPITEQDLLNAWVPALHSFLVSSP